MRSFTCGDGTPYISFGTISGDQFLSLAVKDHHPGNATLLLSANSGGYFFSVGHPVGVNFEVDVINFQRAGHYRGVEELLEFAAPTSPGSTQMKKNFATILTRLLQSFRQCLLRIDGG